MPQNPEARGDEVISVEEEEVVLVAEAEVVGDVDVHLEVAEDVGIAAIVVDDGVVEEVDSEHDAWTDNILFL